MLEIQPIACNTEVLARSEQELRSTGARKREWHFNVHVP